ncbi:hypothetical protein B0J13DRAFT_564827 [Dactylonectria estremocensis]|uniref:F-box domain-containing protein n=1 Tax=Dactylonectria estremocensis TaxID=1079267 RepID=A0A9P9DX85_9HYPO|nr:hypothetical protein B0J13DRAFT_564827 [Dactylonectria estremocensis]
MASPLLDTPADIIRSIFSSLGRRELVQLCLVNTDLRALAEPFLYATPIYWKWEASRTPPIVSLLRSIMRRPQLADFIQHVLLVGTLFERDQHQYRRESPKLVVAEEDLDAAIECIKGKDMPFGEAWIRETRSGTMDAFVALLLSRLPRLKAFYIGENFTRESRLVGMVLRSALCEHHPNLPRYEHLEDAAATYFSLGIDLRRHTDIRNTADVLALFYLPSVKRIRASLDNPDIFTWPAAQPPSPSRLETLDLTMIREGNLGQVLSVTSGLKKLLWDWYYRPDLEDRFVTDAISLDRLASDLSHVRGTLTHLTITAATDMSRAEPDFPPVQITGNFNIFANLNVLKRIEVPLPFLLGFSPWGSDRIRLAERLPPSIEVLTITDDLYLQDEWMWRDVDLLQTLRLWLEDWRKTTPCLQKFHLLLKMMDYEDWGPEMRQELEDLGTKVGIEIEITKLAGSM